MDLIKKEEKVDPLAVQWCNDADIEDGNPSSHGGKSLHRHMSGIKTEYMDPSCDLKSEITFEEISAPVDFSALKSEAEEECCKLDPLKEEVKLEVRPEENEVLTDRLLLHEGRVEHG
ncbi:uncharacterized protein [Periplaneta americana]|uniref:uncharacterized protein isoform X2 n=1 Tax=Periplaneta americana TaxID=6978 RepID=UPI0037E9A479